jgi:hypothetical protein
LNESIELLSEHVKGVREVVAQGRYQVTDLGTHGWYHLYSAVKVGKADVARLKAWYKDDEKVAEHLTTVHPVDDYHMGIAKGSKDASPFVIDEQIKDLDMPNALQEASAKMLALGVPKQHTVVIWGTLEAQAGKEYKSAAGLSIKKFHAMYLKGGKRSAVTIIHEWAHNYWYNRPKGVRRWFKQWFIEHVVKPLAKTAKVKDADLEAFRHALKSSKTFNLRNTTAFSGKAPTAYALTEYGELWAETVAYAADRPGRVSPELRKAMFAVFSGQTPAVESENYTVSIPDSVWLEWFADADQTDIDEFEYWLAMNYPEFVPVHEKAALAD